MAVKRNKTDMAGQKAGPEKEPTENQGTEGEVEQMPEVPKALIATRPILYLAKQYKAGDRLPLNNQEMVEAWIEAGSAAWQESAAKQLFP